MDLYLHNKANQEYFNNQLQILGHIPKISTVIGVSQKQKSSVVDPVGSEIIDTGSVSDKLQLSVTKIAWNLLIAEHPQVTYC